LFSDLPFAPCKEYAEMNDFENDLINKGMEFSDVMKRFLKSYTAQKRLMLSFRAKKEYTLHSEELKFYVRHGMIVEEIVAGFEFRQEAFMKGFVEMVINYRNSCTDETQLGLLKLVLNAIFGKSVDFNVL
jgi:hypothetical protein